MWGAAAQAASLERVWSLETPEDWSSRDITLLQSVAAVVPAPSTPVVLRRSHEPLSGPLDALAHTVVQPRRQGALLVVSTVGLAEIVAAAVGEVEEASAEALTEEVLRRRLVHGLMHRLDQEHGWSSDRMWMGLSEWGAGKPGERDPLSYAELRGMTSSAEDLAVLAEHTLMGRPLPWDPPIDAACRMRSKWRMLTEWLDTPGTAPQGTCPSLEQVGLSPERIEAVDVIYVQASTRSPASLAGHLGIGLVYAGRDGRKREVVYQLGADTDGVKIGSPEYILRGIWGGFQGLLLWEPYRRTVLRYSDEGRSVSRLRLRLTDAEKVRLLERLDDLRQSWQRTYRFFTRNCSHMPKALLEWTFREEIELPVIFGPDAVLADLERSGRLETLPGETLHEFSRYDRARLAASLREATAARLRQQCHSQCAALETALRGGERRSVTQRASAYLALSTWGRETSTEALVQRYLVWSEQIEHHKEHRSGEESPALQALWTVLPQSFSSTDLTASSTAQEAAGDNEASLAITQATSELISALEEDIRGRGQRYTVAPHTPLNRIQVRVGGRQSEEAVLSTLSMETALYSARLGESRRYASASGLEMQLLRSNLRLLDPASTDAQLEVDLQALQLRRVWSESRVLNPGFSARLVGLQRQVSIDGAQVRLDVLELGGLIELWQHDRHRHHLLVGAGVLGGVVGGWAGRSLEPLVETPIRLAGRLGSATDPLTGLSLEAAWTPALLQAGRLEAVLSAQRGLGEVRDIGIALAGDVRLQTLEDETTYALLLGLWLERY